MPTTNQKRIGKPSQKETVTLNDSLGDAWKVIKPFAKFSFKAMKLIAHTLVYIVKHIPRPEEDKPKSNNPRVIKIS